MPFAIRISRCRYRLFYPIGCGYPAGPAHRLTTRVGHPGFADKRAATVEGMKSSLNGVTFEGTFGGKDWRQILNRADCRPDFRS
jgi:hypothetical protein